LNPEPVNAYKYSTITGGLIDGHNSMCKEGSHDPGG